MTATVTGRGPVAGGTVVGSTVTGRRPARRGFAFPRASSTPGKVRLIRMGLVIACLGWGALAALMVGQHASAAGDAASVSEPLSLDAQQMYQSLADADVTASTGYLYGRIQPFPGRQRYQQDRSEEHTSELQSHHDLVCRLLLEKKKKKTQKYRPRYPN